MTEKTKQATKVDSPVSEKKEEIKSEETKVAPIVQNEEEIAKEHFFNAMELMFEDRTLDRQFLDSPLSAEELAERHEKVKAAILALPSKYINNNTTYIDGMMGRQQTLLLQAIMNIKDPLRRFEIVQMLLDKGANPLKAGFCQVYVETLKEAEATRDTALIALIKAAIDKQNKTDAPTDKKEEETKVEAPMEEKEQKTKVKALPESDVQEIKLDKAAKHKYDDLLRDFDSMVDEILN